MPSVSLSKNYHYDWKTGDVKIETVQDVEPILEANKRAYNDNNAKKSEIFNKKATIPLVVLEKWLADKGITYREFMIDEKLVKRFVNDPDNRFCLCKPGKM
jgi:hypothetical protein